MSHGPAKGAGWGGPAKGAGWKPGDPLRAGHGRPEGVEDGQGKKVRAKALLAEAAELAVQRVINVALDDGDPRNLQAAFGILNRTGMHEKAGVEVGGDEEKPLVVQRVIIDPPKADRE